MVGYYNSSRWLPGNTGPYTLAYVQRGWDRLGTLYPSSAQRVYSYRTHAKVESDIENVQAQLDASRIDALRSPTDTGHPFWVEKHSVSPGTPITVPGIPGNYNAIGIYGNIFVDSRPGALSFKRSIGGPKDISFAFEDFPDATELNKLGMFALDQTAPTNPTANLSQLYGELLEELPRLSLEVIRDIAKPGGGRPTAKSAGSDYLNSQFGFQPLVKDLTKLCIAVVRSKEIMKKFSDQSGKPLKRSFSGPAVDQTKLVFNSQGPELFLRGEPGVGLSDLSSNPLIQSGSVTTSTTQNVTKTWRFEGSWQYFLAEGSTFFEKFTHYEQLANKLLGTRITPDVLWELTPWSWLVDWFSDIGTLLSINSKLQQDNLVLRYGYLTCKTVQRTYNSANFTDHTGRRHSLGTYYEASRLERIRATPYGFGLNLDGLTAQQWAILAALGFSRRVT